LLTAHCEINVASQERLMGYTHRDLDAYLSRHNICIAAADYILRAAAGLARDVGAGGYSCVVTEYQSRKMGVTVNTESRTAELLYAIELDFDPLTCPHWPYQ
jgi:hypothetical protein